MPELFPISNQLEEFIRKFKSETLTDYLWGINNKFRTAYFKKLSREKQLKNLKEAYENQKLVLILGAGTSKVYGLPDWSTLLQKLLIKSLESSPETSNDSKSTASLIKNVFSPNPLILARDIQLRYKNNDEEMLFENDVREALYQEIKDDMTKPLFKEIRQLCIAPGNSPNIDSIITFNYDDTLENCLSQLEIEIPFRSIYSAGMQPKAWELPIYHVNGFLPRNGKLDFKNKIALSEDIYHQLYTDIYCWSNIIQLNKFTNNTCFFIGTSFTDPNLRRLLDIAKEQREEKLVSHYIIRKRHEKQEVKEKISNIILEMDDKISSEEEFHRKIDDTAQALIKIVESFEEEDALSFGVSIIWIDDFNEVPIILSQVRQLHL